MVELLFREGKFHSLQMLSGIFIHFRMDLFFFLGCILYSMVVERRAYSYSMLAVAQDVYNTWLKCCVKIYNPLW